MRQRAYSGEVTDPYTNPDELFDVCDSWGSPTGATKRRADVHRDGDWHRSLHCWVSIVGPRGPAVLLQRRGAGKDTWPLRLDVAVGGHLGAGEDVGDVVREVEEEIGRAARLGELVRLGRRVAVGEGHGFVDREIQEVFLWRTELPLEAFRPQPGELDALIEAPLTALLRLQAGQVEAIAVRALRADGSVVAESISADQFVTTVDRYFLRGAAAVDLVLTGYPFATI